MHYILQDFGKNEVSCLSKEAFDTLLVRRKPTSVSTRPKIFGGCKQFETSGPERVSIAHSIEFGSNFPL